MSFNTELMKRLVNAYSPSGDESEIAGIIEEELKDHVDEISRDSMGNLICRKVGGGKRIMVAAHMDQIGVMVTKIEDEGFLRFTNIGGIDPVLSLNQRVVFKNGTVGVIDKNGKAKTDKLKLEDLFIDIGADGKEEAEKAVEIGDSAVYVSDYHEDEKRIISGALDNRIGCYMGIEALKRLKESENDIYMVFTVQEELGLRGATTAAYAIEPEFGLALDITGSGDTPEDGRLAVGLGKGAAIKLKDRGIVVDPRVKNYMVDMAKVNDIDYQLEILEFGATDSGAIHLSKSGVPTGVISVPTRFVHSPTETIYKSDVEHCIDLLVKILGDSLEFLG
ncbi:putative aminopeptidase YsdC [Andreesenia angusta]|uniref:Putative aminopeptidase YsdC n=1 Tax=Andreesenia angusta TaxID=39480 RepID=A0A1S1V967_9FIRM|nr:M42 family metallopeptidase [Andreesenia angusta]OHW62955.1 putative aminopeptidase YsdC [Andreesenia angusta]